jgi:AcrR family transcriptional regulator
MTEIAAAAGVSDRTVYLAFPTKAALLSQCIRAAARGDDDEAPMLARADWHDVLEASPDRMLALLADACAQLMSRAAGLLAVGESIGIRDPHLDAARARGRAATHADSLELAKALKRAQLLRDGIRIEDAADIIYAIAASESLYLRLVHHRGWSDEAYARLIERTLTATLTQ